VLNDVPPVEAVYHKYEEPAVLEYWSEAIVELLVSQNCCGLVAVGAIGASNTVIVPVAFKLPKPPVRGIE
jgi:hypothetical protein